MKSHFTATMNENLKYQGTTTLFSYLDKKKSSVASHTTKYRICTSNYFRNPRMRFSYYRLQLICILLYASVTIPQSNCSVLPAYIWPLAYIYNQTVPITPPMAVHGGVKQIDENGLHFDGETGWIDAGDFSGECIAQPSKCKGGLSLGLRIKLDHSEQSDSRHQFIFDSGGHNGKGVSVFLQNGKFFVQVGNSSSIWQVSTSIEISRWHFVLATWSPKDGLLLFVDGPLVTKSDEMQKLESNVNASNNHICMGKANDKSGSSYGQFSMEMIAVFNAFVPTGRVFMTYAYSPPGQPNGNIRYVNVRFVNRGKANVQIFPDRGQKRETGYSVTKQSSTLLEFVLREGPLPYGMDFLVKRNEGDVLKLNEKDWIHIDASDDIQVVAEVIVLNDKIQQIIFSTKGIVPNFFAKSEKRPGKELLSDGSKPETKVDGSNKITTTVVDAMLSPSSSTTASTTTISSTKTTTTKDASSSETTTTTITTTPTAKMTTPSTTTSTTKAAKNKEQDKGIPTKLPTASKSISTSKTTSTSSVTIKNITKKPTTTKIKPTLKDLTTKTFVSTTEKPTTTISKTITKPTKAKSLQATATKQSVTKRLSTTVLLSTTKKPATKIPSTTILLSTTKKSTFPSRTKPLPTTKASSVDETSTEQEEPPSKSPIEKNSNNTTPVEKGSDSNSTTSKNGTKSKNGEEGTHRPGEGRTETELSSTTEFENRNKKVLENMKGTLVSNSSLGNAECKNCSTTEHILISSEKSKNGSVIDNMKILSAIQGNVNDKPGGVTQNNGQPGSTSQGQFSQTEVWKGGKEIGSSVSNNISDHKGTSSTSSGSSIAPNTHSGTTSETSGKNSSLNASFGTKTGQESKGTAPKEQTGDTGAGQATVPSASKEQSSGSAVGHGQSGVLTAGTGQGVASTAGTGTGSVSISGTGQGTTSTAGTGQAGTSFAGMGTGSMSTSATGQGTTSTAGTGQGGKSTAGTGTGDVSTTGAGQGGKGTGSESNAGTGIGGVSTAGTGQGGVATTGTIVGGVSTAGTGTGGVSTAPTEQGSASTAGTGPGGASTVGTSTSGVSTASTGQGGSSTVGTGQGGASTAGTGTGGLSTALTGQGSTSTAGARPGGASTVGTGAVSTAGTGQGETSTAGKEQGSASTTGTGQSGSTGTVSSTTTGKGSAFSTGQGASTGQSGSSGPPARQSGTGTGQGWTTTSAAGQSGQTVAQGGVSIGQGESINIPVGQGSSSTTYPSQGGASSVTEVQGGSVAIPSVSIGQQIYQPGLPQQPGSSQTSTEATQAITGTTQIGSNWKFQPGGSSVGMPQTGCVQAGGSQFCIPQLTTATPATTTLFPTTTTTTTTTEATTPATTTTTTYATTPSITPRKPTTKSFTTTSYTNTPPPHTKYITNPSPTKMTLPAIITTTKKTTKSKVTYPTPRILPTRLPCFTPPCQQSGYQVDIYNVYQQLPGSSQSDVPQIESSQSGVPQIESGMDLVIGNVNHSSKNKNDKLKKPSKKPPDNCVNIPNCNSSVVGVKFNGKMSGKMGLSVLTPHANGKDYTLQNHEVNLQHASTNFDMKNPNRLLNMMAGSQNIQNAYNYQNQYPQMGQNLYFRQGMNSDYQPYNQVNLGTYQGNNYGVLGSPQVYNWKSSLINMRSKNSQNGNAKTESSNVLDDEMLSSIKDISNGNPIYTSNNAKLDNISPSKLWRNSMLITINKGLPIMTSAHLISDKEEKKEKNLPIVGTKETLSGHDGVTLLLTDIKDGVIQSAPELQTHGTIRKWQGGLKFDGKTAWINANGINASFLADLSLAQDGFAVGFKLMLDNGIQNFTQPKYILDGGGVDGHGVSLFVEKGALFGIVSANNNMWQVSSSLNVDEWVYIILAWKQTDGLYLYVNGMKKSEASKSTPSTLSKSKSKNILIGANRNQDKNSFLLMYLASIDILKTFPNAQELIEFAPPIVKDSSILTFTSIKEDAVQNHVKLKVHGSVKENRGTLQFDGIHAFLHDTGEYADTYIMMPSLNPAGLSFSVKFKFDRVMVQSTDEKFILDTGGWLGHGVSLFVYEGQLTAVVGSKGKVWVAQTSYISFTSWSFVLVTWREDMGIFVYINGALMEKEKSYRYLIQEYAPFDGFTIGCSILKGSPSFARFHLAMISFFPTYTTIDELMKFSPPLVLRPTFDWFFMLIQNGTTLTSPPLKVNGGVISTEDGLLFNGKDGSLNAGSLQELSEENAEIICEHYEKEITCPPGQIIKVAYANYGRTSDIPCQGKRKYITTNCKSKKTLPMTKELCDGKRACRIKALNSYWGNTCPGVIKYLDIRYQCVGKVNQENGVSSSRTHFVINPRLTKKGLTIAMKIKLHKDSADYTTPHFIVDSGGSHGNGVSIYTMNKMLFCEISTGNSTWKVNASVATDDWMYLLLTWNKYQGMVLYINGVIKDISSHPIALPTDVSENPVGILVLGRSATNETNSFTRFQITLFTVLKTFTPRSESFRMFAYYVGRAITNAFEAASMNQDTVLVCEYQSRTISCPADQVIEIVFANFGRTSSRPCAWGTHHETNCTLPSAKNTAREYCDGRNSCELVAKNSMWKINPCPGIIKYVEVKYICNEVGPSAVTESHYVGNEDPNSLVIP